LVKPMFVAQLSSFVPRSDRYVCQAKKSDEKYFYGSRRVNR
jgi:hypothetical protein